MKALNINHRKILCAGSRRGNFGQFVRIICSNAGILNLQKLSKVSTKWCIKNTEALTTLPLMLVRSSNTL